MAFCLYEALFPLFLILYMGWVFRDRGVGWLPFTCVFRPPSGSLLRACFHRHRKLNGQMQLGTSNLHHPRGKVPSDYIETNVASINLDEDIEHPAMFPEELIEPFVKATTEKDDLVLDVFAGSGTTGVVALDLGRRFVGYEINGDFCKLCEQRLESLNEVENTP